MEIKKKVLNISGTFADGDVLVDSVAVNDFLKWGSVVIRSVLLLDKDKQSVPIDILVMRQNVSIGTAGEAVSISDVNANRIYGVIQITDYVALGNNSIAQRDDLWVPVESLDKVDDLYIALIARGTATFTKGLALKFGTEEV